jgi:hypothetical protein
MITLVLVTIILLDVNTTAIRTHYNTVLPPDSMENFFGILDYFSS